MATAIVEELRVLLPEQREVRLRQLIDDEGAGPEDKAVGCVFVGMDHRRAGRPGPALSTAALGLTLAAEPVTVARLLTVRALASLDVGDVVEALAAVDAVPDVELPIGLRGELVGVKARGHAHRRDATAFGWFAEAIELFEQAKRPENVAAMQIEAAILALGLDDLVTALEWVTQIDFEPYVPSRAILLAQIRWMKGDAGGALQDIEFILVQHAEQMDENDEGRAYYIMAMCYQRLGDGNQSAHVLEKAARKVFSSRTLDLDLVRRFQHARGVA